MIGKFRVFIRTCGNASSKSKMGEQAIPEEACDRAGLDLRVAVIRLACAFSVLPPFSGSTRLCLDKHFSEKINSRKLYRTVELLAKNQSHHCVHVSAVRINHSSIFSVLFYLFLPYHRTSLTLHLLFGKSEFFYNHGCDGSMFAADVPIKR